MPTCRRRFRSGALAGVFYAHEFQRARRLVPVGLREDDYTVRYDPALVDLGHPVIGLAQRMVRITAARPVAQRHRARHATLAWVDAAAVLGGHQAQVEHVRLGTQVLHHMARALGEAPGFGDLARTSAVVARAAADDQHTR